MRAHDKVEASLSVCAPLTSPFRLAPLGSLLVLGTLLGCKDSSGPDPDIDEPCVATETLVLGATVTGALAATDCELAGGELSDRYTFTTTQQRAVRFSQRSSVFDTYLEIFDAEGLLLGANDDSASTLGSPTSTFKMILPAGTYDLSPSSYEAAETGAYSLSAVSVPESENVCDLIFAMPGISTIGELASGDCTTGGTTPFLFEVFVVAMRAGRTYTMTLNSTAFDAYLVLSVLDGQQVAQNDDANGTNARITYTATASNFYTVFVSTKTTSQLGAYTLIVE